MVKNKIMYGKKVKGIERSTFLIGPDGVLRQEWRGVKVAGHVDAVLKAVQELKETLATAGSAALALSPAESACPAGTFFHGHFPADPQTGADAQLRILTAG